MSISVFNTEVKNTLQDPMFFGPQVNTSRFDVNKYPIFNQFNDLQQSFFWRPEEVNLSKDVSDFNKLKPHEQHIFTENLKYQCLVEGTEVLTKNGWVDLVHYDGKEEIMVYDLMSETMKWEVPVNKFTKQHNGDVYEFSANCKTQFQQIVTPEHRMPYKTRKSKLKRFELAESMEYKNTIQAPITGNLIGMDEVDGGSSITPLEALMIATQADGRISERHSGALSGRVPINFCLSKKRKIKRLLSLAYAAGLEVRFKETHIFPNPNTQPNLSFDLMVPVELNPHEWKKFNTWVDLGNRSAEWCRSFVSEVVLWDGSVYEGGIAPYYCTTDEENADIVQAIGALAGFSPRMFVRSDNRQDYYKDIYTIRFVNKQFKNGESINKTKQQYNGLVSCVTVSTGAFMVRYNKTVSISGNCLLDSVQGRAPALALLSACSLPELESWILTWTFFENCIHSKSYSHIIQNVYTDPSKILDGIIESPEIIDRAKNIALYQDKLINMVLKYDNEEDEEKKKTMIPEMKKALLIFFFVTLMLEAVRFYISFSCSWAFAEGMKLMEGNAKIIKFIARRQIRCGFYQ